MTDNRSYGREFDSPGFGQQEKPNSNVTTAKEMLENNITEIPMLWGHYFPKNGLAVISGNSDTGKSTLMRQLSAAIVTGEDHYLGLSLNPVHRSVIYVCTEDDVTSVSSRLKREFEGTHSTEQFVNLRYIFDDENVYEQIEYELEIQPADCIILDALGDIFEGDMNNMTSVRNFFKPYKALADKYNCLIVMVAHNRKSASINAGKADVLGSQAFEAKPRVVLMLSKTPVGNIKELSVAKGNFIPEELKKTNLALNQNANGVYQLLNEGERNSEFTGVPAFENPAIKRILELREARLPYRDIAIQLKSEGIKMSKSKAQMVARNYGLSQSVPVALSMSKP